MSRIQTAVCVNVVMLDGFGRRMSLMGQSRTVSVHADRGKSKELEACFFSRG